MSKESPTKMPSPCCCCCCVEEVVLVLVLVLGDGSYRMGSVRKSLPSACLRTAGTPSFLRVAATSGRGTQVVR